MFKSIIFCLILLVSFTGAAKFVFTKTDNFDKATICNGLKDGHNKTQMLIVNEASGSTIRCGPAVEIGECKRGIAMCNRGVYTCLGAVEATPEICDGLDNNCNGEIDEGLVNCVPIGKK